MFTQKLSQIKTRVFVEEKLYGLSSLDPNVGSGKLFDEALVVTWNNFLVIYYYSQDWIDLIQIDCMIVKYVSQIITQTDKSSYNLSKCS